MNPKTIFEQLELADKALEILWFGREMLDNYLQKYVSEARINILQAQKRLQLKSDVKNNNG